jgi:hypothetical protein
MDIIKILKKLREFKFIKKEIYNNPNLKFELQHSKAYLIDLEGE